MCESIVVYAREFSSVCKRLVVCEKVYTVVGYVRDSSSVCERV